jgi:hypothetical protein
MDDRKQKKTEEESHAAVASQQSEGDVQLPALEERARAADLAQGVDNLLAGIEPAALDPQDSAMIAMIRCASAADASALDRGRRDELIKQALERGVCAQPRRRGRRVLPWAASLGALAALLLVVFSLTLFSKRGDRAPRTALSERSQVLPTRGFERRTLWRTRSRSSDALLGGPIRDRAGASARLDRLLDDRLGGYRLILLAKGERP